MGNPFPEVAVARDAAGNLGEIIGTPVKQIVVLIRMSDGKCGRFRYDQWDTDKDLGDKR